MKKIVKVFKQVILAYKSKAKFYLTLLKLSKFFNYLLLLVNDSTYKGKFYILLEHKKGYDWKKKETVYKG